MILHCTALRCIVQYGIAVYSTAVYCSVLGHSDSYQSSTFHFPSSSPFCFALSPLPSPPKKYANHSI